MQEILPPIPEPQPTDEPAPDWLIDPEDLPPALEFTPVPRKRNRSNGLTPMRQRAFIAYLSANGSVEMSAKAIGASDTSLYLLKKAEGAESFAAAWDAAIDMGARRVLDTMMDHAIHGTPEKLLQDGNIILERRKFNTRAMMFIVQQRFPELYGGNLNLSARPASSLPHGIQKLKEEWRKEWEEEAAAQQAEAEAQYAAEYNSTEATMARFLEKYQAKVREEYFFRAEGNAIAADFALRQLAMMEVAMDVGGISYALIKEHFHNAKHGGPWSTEVSRALEDARHTAWAQAAAEMAAGGEGEPYPPPERPLRPFYYDEAMMAADVAARQQLVHMQGNYSERKAAEAEYRASRHEGIERSEGGEKPEGDTFLPGG